MRVSYIGSHKQLVLKYSKIVYRFVKEFVVLTCNLWNKRYAFCVFLYPNHLWDTRYLTVKTTKIIGCYRYKNLRVSYIGSHKQLVLKYSKIVYRFVKEFVVLTCNLWNKRYAFCVFLYPNHLWDTRYLTVKTTKIIGCYRYKNLRSNVLFFKKQLLLTPKKKDCNFSK